ncbi:hypothetical protein ACWDUN_04010 [Mycobacterium sp. NPDC003323]
MAQVLLDTVKLFYEESKSARALVEGQIDKYRANSSTLLALATAAVAFFGFSTGPRQQVFFWIAICAYLAAVAMAFLIFKPIPAKVNVAFDTDVHLAVSPPVSREQIYYNYACGHQDAIGHALGVLDGKFGVAKRFRILIAAIALLIIAASLSVIFGTQGAPGPTRVIIERSS